MSADIAIICDGLSKQYRIGERESYKALRDVISDAAAAPYRRLRMAFDRRPTTGDGSNGHRSSVLGPSSGPSSGHPSPVSGPPSADGSVVRQSPSSATFWALDDVSFEVKRGEVVGIIGRNGAGKSTLLKILSRITKPTEGHATIHGRVGSLLEVGTGFHPELTGRENIYLNAAILGMRKAEVAKKFDEIVAFAEVEQFIDTPVKRYSSGMYVRLAFAVAAHMETEILLVDEVLAVGDMQFQKKCLRKIGEVASQDRTVVFVSHNMPSITRLCNRTILLEEGRKLSDGPSSEVVGNYLRSGFGTSARREWSADKGPGNQIVRLSAIRVRGDDGEIAEIVDIRKPVSVEIEYEVITPGHVLVPNYHFYNEEGSCVFIAHDCDPEWHRRRRAVGRYVSTASVPGNFLAEGTLIVGVAISTHDPVTVHLYEPDAAAFQVVDTIEGGSARGDYAGNMPGAVRPLLHWSTSFFANSKLLSGQVK